MLERYTAVDVETPNRNNDSICSIGIVHMEYGAPVYRREFLVNPREHFDDFNIKIHGITPKMVQSAPVFPEIWPEIAPFFGGIMAAHSATFDLGVVCKTLAVYGLPVPDITYICSLQKAKKHIPKELYGSHKLNDLCAGLKLPLEHHHDSLDDALGCALIIETLTDRFGVQQDDIRTYHYKGVQLTVSRRERREAIQALWNTMEKYGRKKKLFTEYHEALEDWTRKYDKYIMDPDIHACHDLIEAALQRGSVTEAEYDLIMGL